MEQSKERKTNSSKKAWINKKIPPRLKFIITCFVQFLLALASVYVLVKANTFANTANLLQINNAIQDRTNAVLAARLKNKELEMWVNANYVNNSDFLKDINIRTEINGDELRAAIYSLLNTYEFACIQYIENKIDKKAFKLFYSEMIKYIKKEYSSYFENKDSQENYQAINKVYKEWAESPY